jgi:hypothetical protein
MSVFNKLDGAKNSRIRISSSINLKRDEKYGENMRRAKEHANKNNNKISFS